MSSKSLKYAHPIDQAVQDGNMFSWYVPAFRLLGTHWPVAFVAAIATWFLVLWIESLYPWSYRSLVHWWVGPLHAYLIYAIVSVVAVLAYRAIAHREGTRYALGDVNPPGRAIVCALQASLLWVTGSLVVIFVLGLLVKGIISMLGKAGRPGAGILILFLIIAFYGIPLFIFLLAPLWVLVGVTGSLTNAHAARSLESGFSAVTKSFGLVFSQKWRVIWPAYLIGAVLGLIVFLQMRYSILPAFLGNRFLVGFLSVASVAYGMTMTFVIERVYAPDLGIEPGDDYGTTPDSAQPTTPALPVGSAPPAGSATTAASAVRTTSAPAAAPPTGPAIAAAIEEELRDNRTAGLADLAERGLAADARFFATHPDSTVALAKRLVQAQRADLALRVLQPYVKDHRAHRLHLTGALLAAELLGRIPDQLQVTAKFLAQLQAVYPAEPMVERLVRLNEKALAQATAPKPPSA